ncbi:secreted protein, putative [Ixodes scapularis]|uniref:Secreted protein, putative n=1 Tax=Ixodes scapularis TaxID=6945 RepID=B7PT84_IXOSC|nr:secreted protein, putative [Ixodes scapularis]|eukprot:XP_002404024.1 secreted protein, putative [Ixodes scapularis]
MAKISTALIVALCVAGGLASALVKNQAHFKTHVDALVPDEAPQEIFPEPPLEPEVTVFMCTFEHHACGMRNQRNTQSRFKRKSEMLAGKPGFHMVVDAQKAGYNVARLITPYMPVYANTTACVAIAYVVNGPGADRLEIVAQDSDNRHLLTLPNGASNWRHVEQSINVTQDVRFFISAYTKSNAEGVIAIDNFRFHLSPCFKN